MQCRVSNCAELFFFFFPREGVYENLAYCFSFRFDEKFFTFCSKELAKINTFYAEKLAEATRKFATLKNEIDGSEYDNLTKKGHKKIQKRKVCLSEIIIINLLKEIFRYNLENQDIEEIFFFY